METRDVTVIGGGVAGLTAALFTARAGLDTLVLESGESILARNAHLENVPGFPAGVDARLFLDLTREQAETAGVDRREGGVVAVRERDDGRLDLEVGGGDPVVSDYVVCASWSDADYLHEVDVGLIARGSKTYVDVDEDGSTGVDGLYAAGRLAGKEHQTVVAAGHGGEVGLAVVHDSEIPFYHDWVAPEGYFTDRDREVPPGCEEIDEDERERRAAASRERMREAFAEPRDDDPTMHPSVAEED
jgi:thioredoxin reductase